MEINEKKLKMKSPSVSNCQPKSRQPISRQPISRQPKSREPKSREPKSRQPKSLQPNSRQPNSHQPNSRQPNSHQPNSYQPNSHQPNSREPKSREPKSREPKSREPKSREPKSREPKSREPKSRQPKSRQPKSRQPKSRQGASKSSTTSCNPKKENPTDPENVKSNPAVPEPRSGDVMPTANAKVEGPQECHQKLEKIKPKRSQTAIDPWKGVCVICPAEYARRKRHNNPEFAVSSDKSANASGTCDEVVDQTSGEELIQALSSERHEWMDPLPDSVINELIIDYLSD